MIPVCSPSLEGNELAYVTEAVESGWISSGGKFVKLLEDNFANFVGSKYAVAVSSGTAALHIALVALDIGPGDEVIVPALTMIATGNCVLYTGAKPVIVDVEPVSGNVDVDQVISSITPRTKAVIPVHLYGLGCNILPLIESSSCKGVKVIEDAAEAIGTVCNGRPAGTLGLVGCFSFYANKVITTGEGGALVTDDPELYEKFLKLRDQWYVPERRFFHPGLGYNYRMTNLQAAVGVAQLERVDTLCQARTNVADRYRNLLQEVDELILPPPQHNGCTNSYWMYAVRLREGKETMRDELAVFLGQRGIETRPFFVPLNLQPAFARFQTRCPVAERLSKTGLLLPTGPKLTPEEQSYVADSIKQFFASRR